MHSEIVSAIGQGNVVLGIELGSTRIKAVLCDEHHTPIASGGHDWENRLEDGIWTYHLDDVWSGLRDCIAKLAADVERQYGVPLERVAALGISAMMHGYLAFDAAGNLLVPFRTWRNTCTGPAAEALTKAFAFNVPQRWSIAHLYQSVLNGEEHVKDIAFLTTLAGYVHWKLTGKKVLGAGDASGMFPLDSTGGRFDGGRMAAFGRLVAERNYPWRLDGILPEVLPAGADAGHLTEEGAKLLGLADVCAGTPLCPPEGDAATGMVATNSVAPRTGNVSAGTSIFAMVVLEQALSKVYPEIDIVTTPTGKPVAMALCNNCKSDLDAWVQLFLECAAALGAKPSKTELYDVFYNQALAGEADGGGLLSYNFLAGEHVVNLAEGRPLFVRTPAGRFNLANFSRTLVFSCIATLKIGMDILTKQEHVKLDKLLGHGGLFKTELAGQKLLAGAMDIPVVVMASAGEGGAWGIALLAAYMRHRQGGETLEEYLEARVFSQHKSSRVEPDETDVRGFDAYMRRYTRGLAIERAAVEHLE